jgi:hypothetical protein
MDISLTNVAGGIARLLLSAAVLFFNGPRLLGPGIGTHSAAAEHMDARPDTGRKAGFHATVTVGHGEKQVTVQLEFGGARERAEDEGL